MSTVALTLIIASLVTMIVCVVIAIVVSSTLKSAVALAAASAALGIIMYALGSAWAGIFEISVCSGFVTVIFISAVTMTSHGHDEQDEMYAQSKSTKWLPILMIVVGVVMLIVLLCGGFKIPETAQAPVQKLDFSTELWTKHQDLIFALMIASLAGAFAVIVLFKEGDKK
jgi:NADH:ubiquinone oxidoreductase subunit 6 (subunit J)